MFLDRVRELMIGIAAVVMSYLAPVEMAIVVLFIFAIVDVFAGFAGNKKALGEEFKFNKAFNAITKMCFFMSFVILAHLVFAVFDEQDIAKVITKYLSWIIVYWYIVNILSNMVKVYPKSRAIKFLLDLFELQVMQALGKWIGIDLDDARKKTAERRENEEDAKRSKE